MRNLLWSLFLIALVFTLVCIRYRPPSPKRADAPAADFSAARARQYLQGLVGDGTPHPIGSAANEQVRSRILSELLKMGYAPEVQRDTACSRFGACGEVKNVLARLLGSEPGPAVLLAAHYDSVSAGPGASDDGAGVAAVLEIARALEAAPPPRHTIILLIDDGEEAGLLGARAFVQSHPWAKDVGAAVNLDARGTSGPSLMFETGSANAWLVHVFSRAVKHPMASSVFYTAYKLLPNDTDFTIFKAQGYQGFNLAFIDNASQYHTPLDNFANADPASMQHQGENALALLRALSNEDLGNLPRGDAVYFDLFALWIVSWPSSWTVWFAALALVLIILAISKLIRVGNLRVSELLWGLIAWHPDGRCERHGWLFPQQCVTRHRSVSGHMGRTSISGADGVLGHRCLVRWYSCSGVPQTGRILGTLGGRVDFLGYSFLSLFVVPAGCKLRFSGPVTCCWPLCTAALAGAGPGCREARDRRNRSSRDRGTDRFFSHVFSV